MFSSSRSANLKKKKSNKRNCKQKECVDDRKGAIGPAVLSYSRLNRSRQKQGLQLDLFTRWNAVRGVGSLSAPPSFARWGTYIIRRVSLVLGVPPSYTVPSFSMRFIFSQSLHEIFYLHLEYLVTILHDQANSSSMDPPLFVRSASLHVPRVFIARRIICCNRYQMIPAFRESDSQCLSSARYRYLLQLQPNHIWGHHEGTW